jgi:hypothetical protein
MKMVLSLKWNVSTDTASGELQLHKGISQGYSGASGAYGQDLNREEEDEGHGRVLRNR